MTIATNQDILASDVLKLNTSTLTNKSGGTRSAGDVVVFDTTNDSAFTTTAYQQDIRVMGVVKESINNNAAGAVYTGAGIVCTINCDAAAIARGQFLVSSTTAGKATAGSYYREAAVFAIALTAKSAGVGTVTAMLVDNFRQAIVGTSGWNYGGSLSLGGAAITTSQKFTMATETWATIAGAALPAVRNYAAGNSYGTTAAYVQNGSNGTGATTAQSSRYKMPYSTEVFSTLTASAVSKAYLSGCINFSSKGFVAGGGDGGTVFSSNYKTTYSTDTEALSNALSSGREFQGGISDGTYCYVGGGGAVTTDRIVESTDALAVLASAALGSAASGYCYGSFPASSGYRAYNNGSGTVYSRKMPFSTATDANNASTPTGNIAFGAKLTDGVAYAYFSGLAAANKLASSTGNFSSISNYPINVQAASASYAAL
jgi:hypothetical protein